MDRVIKEHMIRIVDDCSFAADFNQLLKACIADKEQEDGSWSKITICTHYMLGGHSPHIYRLAAVTELVMLALDMMDDLQDQDHGSKLWMQFPQAITLNAMLALLMGAVGELGRLKVKAELLVEVSNIISRSINGQQKDVTNSAASADDYLLMTQEKSGSLFRFACFMGYAVLDCATETLEQLHDLADCIGLIHQIQNDMKDIVQLEMKGDVLTRKRTLPALYLLSIDDPAFLPFKDYYAGKINEDYLLDNKDRLVQMIYDSGCMEYSRVIQSVCVQKADKIFEQLQAISPWKEKFKEITFASYLNPEDSMEG